MAGPIRYVFGRLAYAASLMSAAIILSFCLFQLFPGDPARIALGANASPQQVAALRAQLGLDQPLIVQIEGFVGRLLAGDLGSSFVDGRAVAAEVTMKLGVSAVLALLASVMAAAYVAAQISRTGPCGAPKGFRALNRAFTAMPMMFTSVVLLVWVFPNYRYNFYPGSLGSFAAWAFLFPPALVLSLYPMGIMGEVADHEWKRLADQPFIAAARARGLWPQRIKWRHELPNALVALLTSYTTILPILLTGAFVVEIVFSVPGIGALLLKSVLARDLPMLQGIVIAGTALTVAIHLAVDLSYPLIDPRVARHGED